MLFILVSIPIASEMCMGPSNRRLEAGDETER